MNELVWWFGQNTLAALLMIPCVMLACRLFRDRPAVQHLLWLVILLKLVTPPIVVWPWSVEELRSMAWSQMSVHQGVHQGANQGASRATFPVAPAPELIELPIESAMVPQVSVPSIEPSSLPALVPVVADNANEKAETTTRTNWGSIVATTAILVWLIGAIVCAVSQLRRLARYARLVRNGQAAPSHLKAEVASVASLLCMQAPVSLIVKGIVSPFLWCVGAARLAWPDSLSSQADVVRSRGIIAHELAHLRRRDHWITWLELGASILWWWNPLFWYVKRQLRETAEMSCDALAIAANPESRREYAELLLRLSSQSTNGVPAPVIAMGAGNVASFERRLKMILSSNVSGNLSWRGALALAVLAVIALPYWSLAQTTNRNRSDSPQSKDSVSEQAVVKRPANPSAYRDMDTALLRRWHQLEGEKQSISESRVATLRAAIGRFIDGLPASQIQLTQDELAELKRLQALGTDKAQHTVSETQAFIESVFAIHGEPIQMAFNEAPWLGTPGNAAELNQLPFGPPDSSGLRVALVCQKEEFIFGDSAQLDIRLWNTGNETILVGIGRDGPGLYPKLELKATDREGHQIATKFGPDSQMLKDTKFARSWQLRPGDTADVSGYRLRVGGSSAPREAMHELHSLLQSELSADVFPQWHTLIEMPDAKSGDEIFLVGVIPSLTRTARSSNEKLQTDSIRIKAIAPEDVEIWSAHSAGMWPMPGGVTLEVKCELFHGADVATSAVLTWPKDAKGTTHAFSSYVASDAFGNREPWHVAWERNSSSFWTIRGNLGDHGPGRAKLFCVNRIDFADKSKIVTTTWYHRPDEMPKGIQLAFEKVFEPLPTTPRLASEAEGFTQVEQAHDVRPIQELLHGVWKSSSNEPSIQMTFPEQDTGDIQWTIDYGKGTPAIEAKLSRIRVPANNAIRLWISPSQLSNVDERDVVGTVRRGPDSTLLLDITGSPKYPEYKKELGIVLTQMPPANATSEMSRNQRDKNTADEKAKVSAKEKVEPWEISKLYDADFLRTYLQDHEALPKPIVVPRVSGKVLDPDGNPASGVSIVSHTPRQWVDLDATLALKPHNSGSVKTSKQDGTFGLPERKEPYRVLFVHESGVGNISHEDLLRANGEVRLQKWASITGTLKLNGKPQADETIVLHFDTLPWSYSRLGPRMTTTHETTTDKNGNFSFDRVPPLAGMAHQLSRTRSLGHGTVFQCESSKNTHIEMDSGNAGLQIVSDNHDHQHDEDKQPSQPTDKPQLPRLIVRTVDADGRPVPHTGVLFYDRDSHRTQKQKFERVSQRTDESGMADLGVMPDSFGCLQLSANKELAKCYTLISATMTTCTQAKPSRANVQTEIKDGILTVTFTMTPHVDLEFNIVDDATDEIVFWSEIFYQDPATNRWWQFALVDGSQLQHNFIPISPQITRETIRISASGYETKEFRLPDELDRTKPIRRDVRLKPMPDIELKVLLPNGTPADKAKLTVHYPNELDCLQIQEELSDAQGVMTTKFPPSADIGIFRLEHTGGTAELPMKELLDDVQQNPGKLIQRSIQLTKSKKQNNAVIEKAVTSGDHTEKPASWIPGRSQKTTVSGGSFSILDDHSVRLEGNVTWQEVTTHFGFDKPTRVDEVRLELLPIDSPSGPQLGRGGEELILSEVTARLEKQTGKPTIHEFSSCISLLNPEDDLTIHCIDFLSDTGWIVPALPADAEAHSLVLRFDEPVTLQPDERLVLTVDSGVTQKFAVLNRIRFAFHQPSR